MRLALTDKQISGLIWQIVVVAIAVVIVGWLWAKRHP